MNWKQQQYKSLLMKGPKTKEKIREARRQIEQLLQLVKRIFVKKNLPKSLRFLFRDLTSESFIFDPSTN